MVNEEHLGILMRGVEIWNAWREAHPDVAPYLTDAPLRDADLRNVNFSNASLRNASLNGSTLQGADLIGTDFRYADLTEANLSGANLNSANLGDVRLINADLSRADLSGANLYNAKLTGADFSKATLEGAKLHNIHFVGGNLSYLNLSDADLWDAKLSGTKFIGAVLARANLYGADLRGADLSGASLRGASLYKANLSGAVLSDVDLTDARLGGANLERAITARVAFNGIDLQEVGGLDQVQHRRKSEISISTIYLSAGKIPKDFLRGCGVPDELITFLPDLIEARQPVKFYSCFISYSGTDEAFARHLHGRMSLAKLRVWFAPEDMKGGDKIYDQIDRAIQVHDLLLLVLSESSLRSKWVETEIRRARKVELREGRRKLFPIRLVGYEALQEWVCIDSTTGEDLAEEVRSYFIPDFSSWETHDDFERAFIRLLDDLKASA